MKQDLIIYGGLVGLLIALSFPLTIPLVAISLSALCSTISVPSILVFTILGASVGALLGRWF